MRDSTLDSNSAEIDGGAVAAPHIFNLAVAASNVTANRARRGSGGAFAVAGHSYSSPSTDRLADCGTLVTPSGAGTDNSSSSSGASTSYMWALGPGARLVGNQAGGGDGGAIALSVGLACTNPDASLARHASLQLSILGSEVSGNTAYGAGGALAVQNPFDASVISYSIDQQQIAVQISSTVLSGNRAGRRRGGTAFESTGSGLGGAVYMRAPPAIPWGSGSGADADLNGANASCTARVYDNSSFVDNTASDFGGGLALLWCSVDVRSSRFVGNRAAASGGAMAVVQDGDVVTGFLPPDSTGGALCKVIYSIGFRKPFPENLTRAATRVRSDSPWPASHYPDPLPGPVSSSLWLYRACLMPLGPDLASLPPATLPVSQALPAGWPPCPAALHMPLWPYLPPFRPQHFPHPRLSRQAGF